MVGYLDLHQTREQLAKLLLSGANGRQLMQDQHLRLASRSPLLAGVSEEVRTCLLTKARVRHFDRGATIFLQGERAANLKIVVGGRVKLYRIAESGCEAVVDLCGEGSSFEEVASLRGESHRLSAQAISDVTLVLVDLQAIGSCPKARQELTSAALSAASDSLDALLSQVQNLKMQNGAQRLAEFLARLCSKEEGSCRVELPYEKNLIAGHLGMKPESLSRAFKRLDCKGVATDRKHVTIADVAALRAYSEEDRALSWA